MFSELNAQSLCSGCCSINTSCLDQWRTQEFCLVGGSANSVEDRGWVVAP